MQKTAKTTPVHRETSPNKAGMIAAQIQSNQTKRACQFRGSTSVRADLCTTKSYWGNVTFMCRRINFQRDIVSHE